MSATISNVCKAATLFCEAAQVVDNVDKLAQPSAVEVNQLQSASVVVSSLILGCNAGEFGSKLTGYSPTALAGIKTAELFLRVINVPLSWHKALTHRGPQDSRILAWVKGVAAPLLSLNRVAAEADAYRAECFIHMSPEQLAQQQAAAPLADSTTGVHRPINRRENEERVQKAQTTVAVLSALEATAHVVANSVHTAPQSLVNIYARLINQVVANQNIHEADQEAEEDPFDLVKLHTIPREFDEDQIFNRYVCPITCAPIRFPATIVGEPAVYEESALTNWLQIRSTSPMTQCVVEVHQVRKEPAIQMIIENRLRFHSERLRQHAQAGRAL